MSNSLVFTLAYNHCGALDSLIGQLPYLKSENVAGKSAAFIQSVSSLSAVSTLSTVQIGFVVSEWYDFHRNIFPSEFCFPFAVLSTMVLYWFVCYYMVLSVDHSFVSECCSRLVL